MKKSAFLDDIEKEKRLHSFLDSLYNRYLKHYSFKRIDTISEQYRGVDAIFTHHKTNDVYYIDEKAQLDYVNDDLPTFAFEISFQKDGKRKNGWLFDSKKKTQFYSLITAIYSDAPKTFTSAKITLVNRQLLLDHLSQRGICNDTIKIPKTHGKQSIPQLNSKDEGYLFFSKKNKAEEPLNLVLYLDFLIEKGVAKRLI